MAIAFISISAKAQDITISGITTGSTKNDVIKILKGKKYEYTIIEGCIIVLNYKNNLSSDIHEILIRFNNNNLIKNISLLTKVNLKIFDTYDEIVGKLKEKYGEPIESEEKYYSPFDEDYKEYPLSAIEYVKKHYSRWEVNNLILLVSVTKLGIFVIYTDTRYQDKETTADY